jgi:hypothetical protein
MKRRIVAPHAVAKEAEHGLYLRKHHGRGGLTKSQAKKEGINSGVERAKQLANQKPLSVEDVKAMYSFFKRHSAFKKHHNEDPPSNALISWKLWGGDAGEKWISKEYQKLQMNEVKKLKPLKVKDMMIDQPETTTKVGLQAIAKKHDIDYQILKKVFMRGLRAFDKSKEKLPKGTNRYQWAYARVNKFVKGQSTAKGVDQKLARKAGIMINEQVCASEILFLLESQNFIFKTNDLIKIKDSAYSKPKYDTAEYNAGSLVKMYLKDKTGDLKDLERYLKKLQTIGQKALKRLGKVPYYDDLEMKKQLLAGDLYELWDDPNLEKYPTVIYVSSSPRDKMTIGLMVHHNGKVEVFEGNDEASDETNRMVNVILTGGKAQYRRLYGQHGVDTVEKIRKTKTIPKGLYLSPESFYASSYWSADPNKPRVMFSGLVDINDLAQESEYDWKVIVPTKIKEFREY